MKNEILVSINCITYNHEKYIAQTIESFLRQKTSFKYEILIHDDCSSDKTKDIINKYKVMYPELIKPIIQSANMQSQGIKKISYKYNHSRARGKYVAFCEGDDYWTDENKLQKQIDFMEQNSDCGLIVHAAYVIDATNDKIINLIRPFKESQIVPVETLISRGGGLFASNSILYRKRVFDNPPEFYFNAHVGDYPMQLITGINKFTYYMDELMSVYRVNVKGSWSSQQNVKDKIIINRIRDCEGNIEILQNFNKYTTEQYDLIIQKAIDFQRLNLKMLSPKYSNERIISKTKLKLSTRISIFTMRKHSGLYILIKRMKSRLLAMRFRGLKI